MRLAPIGGRPVVQACPDLPTGLFSLASAIVAPWLLLYALFCAEPVLGEKTLVKEFHISPDDECRARMGSRAEAVC